MITPITTKNNRHLLPYKQSSRPQKHLKKYTYGFISSGKYPTPPVELCEAFFMENCRGREYV